MPALLILVGLLKNKHFRTFAAAPAITYLLYFFKFISGYSSLLIGLISLYGAILLQGDSDVTLQVLEKFGKSPEKSLRGKIVWLTGASSGIGRGVALKLAEYGCKLALSARSKDKLEELKKECIKVGKLDDGDVYIASFDMLDYQSHEEQFESVLQHFGKIDVLFSNAGCLQRGEWEKFTTNMDREMFEINVFSLVSLARIVTNYFLKQGNGHHVITSSVAGRMPSPMTSPYAATKFALQGYFESLRAEYGSKGIDVTLLDIGPVQTNLFVTAKTTSESQVKSVWKKVMSPERCATLIAVAMAYSLPEVIICIKPTIFLAYFYLYLTPIAQWAMKFINFKKMVENNRRKIE